MSTEGAHMKVGIALAWPDDPASIGVDVARQAGLADDSGIDSVWTADHLFQFHVTGKPPEAPMLEAYAALSFVAGLTRRVTVGALVTCATYRPAGLHRKSVSTLDVLTGGRVVLGLGAGWYEMEARGLGLPFPAARADRYELLEETLRLAHHMWNHDEAPFAGSHLQLDRPLNRPRLERRPPILVGGSGERRTLPLVAQWADACNLFDLAPPFDVDLRHKIDVLRARCDAIGRDPAEIEITVIRSVDLTQPEGAGRLMKRADGLAALGVSHLILSGPTFEWGPTIDLLADNVDTLHAIEAAPLT
jgi:alkanesulfonate monooxygenase SsuD/methylene tetrahydromethanopterin reductase-like flavin-dependent oxidoreductase (luciferase family)